MMKTILKLDQIDTVYGNAPILSGVSMKVDQGKIVGIVGESGSGKSTIICASMGIMRKGGRVTGGRIFYDDWNLLEFSREEMRQLRGKEMSLIAQNPMDSFHPIRKIRKELQLLVKAHPAISAEEAEDEMVRLMEQFGLSNGRELLNRYAFELSGGMCQRMAIAMGMTMKPRILFADEPTSALDVTVQKQVVEELLRVRAESKTAIVLVSHNIGVVAYMADEILVMYAGIVVEQGTVSEVIYRPAHPYTRQLIRAVPKINRPIPGGIHIHPVEDRRGKTGCPFAESCARKDARCEAEYPELVNLSEEHAVRCRKPE